MQKLLAIAGPTASGKSSVAVKLAKKLNGEIISMDSMQIYKGMDIGTAKVSQEEMENIMKPENFTGRSSQQVEEFVNEFVKPILDANSIKKYTCSNYYCYNANYQF